MKYICPHCGEHISHLEYTIGGYSYGLFYIKNEEFEGEGFEEDGETDYECPVCNHNINDPTDLEEVPEEEEEEEEDIAPIRIPNEPNNMLSDFKRPWSNGKTCKECTKCGQVVEFDPEEHEIECPICETKIIKE